MKNNCSKWKDQLLEAALTGTTASELQDHLWECSGCSQQLAVLNARRERLDAALPMLASKQEPTPDFAARVMAAAEAHDARKNNLYGRRWLFAAAAVVIVATFITVTVLRRPPISSDTDLAMAQKLAQWHAPSDTLLGAPGQEILKKTPNLGETYLKLQTNKSKRSIKEK